MGGEGLSEEMTRKLRSKGEGGKVVKWWGCVFQAEGTACVQMLRWGELGLLREGQWDWNE